MKQVYAVGAFETGTTSSLRAVTAGTGSDDLSAAMHANGYAAPIDFSADSEKKLPIRLALLNTTRGRVLTHVTPLRERSSWFAHTLLNVPNTADAQLAIQTWGSPLWQKYEPETSHELPELPYLPVADVLDDAAIKDWLKNPARQELLEFTLKALLGTPALARIFLAANADDVAKVVYAVTRVLPQGLLDDFTFSTYEAAPLSCNARLIGCDPGTGESDIPADCYTGQDVAYHATLGKQTTLTVDVPFAAFAVKAATNGEYAPVDEVKATWQRLGLSAAKQFDLVYRLSRGTGVMTKDEATEMLQHPPLAVYVSARADALNQFLDWSLDDRNFAVSSFTRAAQALRQKPEMANKLAQTVRDVGLKALKAGDVSRTSNALEVILPMIAPAKANAIWSELPALVNDPATLTWEMRNWLLPRFVRSKQQQGQNNVDDSLIAWLNIPTDQLASWLTLDIPRVYQMASTHTALARADEPTETLAAVLAQQPTLTRTLLIPTATGDDKQVQLFTHLLQVAPQTPWLEELLAHAADYPATTLNRYFETALNTGRVDADRLIRTQGPRLLELFDGRSGLDKVGSLLLAQPPMDLLRQSQLLDFITKLFDQEQVTDEVKTRIRAVKQVRSFLNAPSFDDATQAMTAAALSLLPAVVPTSARGEVFDSLVSEFLKHSESSALQLHLETTLIQFGSVLAQDPTDLYENLLRVLRSKTDFGKQANLVGTFLAVALGASQDTQLAGKLNGLEGHAFAIAGDASKRGGIKVLEEVQRRSANWPKPAQTQWSFLSAAVQPRGTADYLRDATMIAAGMAIMGLVWLVINVLS